MEKVIKGMMEELERDCRFNDILHYVYGIETVKGYPFVHSYLMTHDFSNDAYLKVIKHISGDPQFEEEKPKKYVVRSKKTDNTNDYWYVSKVNPSSPVYGFSLAESVHVIKFDTREEAEKWTEPQTEVIEVEG